MRCSVCGKDFGSKRAMHGHLVRVHYDEYKAAGFQQKELIEGATPSKKKESETRQRPEGFRLLNKGNANELAAYNEGFRYIDADNIVYEAAEAEGEGWM